MKKQYATYDLANGERTMLDYAEMRAGRPACYAVDPHIRRNWQGEICGEYFTIRKTRTK